MFKLIYMIVKHIKTKLNEYINESKYVDDILDRKNKYGKISDEDKEYLDKYSKFDFTSNIEMKIVFNNL